MLLLLLTLAAQPAAPPPSAFGGEATLVVGIGGSAYAPGPNNLSTIGALLLRGTLDIPVDALVVRVALEQNLAARMPPPFDLGPAHLVDLSDTLATAQWAFPLALGGGHEIGPDLRAGLAVPTSALIDGAGNVVNVGGHALARYRYLPWGLAAHAGLDSMVHAFPLLQPTGDVFAPAPVAFACAQRVADALSRYACAPALAPPGVLWGALLGGSLESSAWRVRAALDLAYASFVYAEYVAAAGPIVALPSMTSRAMASWSPIDPLWLHGGLVVTQPLLADVAAPGASLLWLFAASAAL